MPSRCRAAVLWLVRVVPPLLDPHGNAELTHPAIGQGAVAI
jgi:hypothetical protein